ncbi:MAG: Gfo/Idh/MocA family oxidoreductase [Tepidisphaeraceae bacterium]
MTTQHHPEFVLSRRHLLNAGVAAMATTVLAPQIVRGADANSRITLGMIGCGGRGHWISDFFRNHGGFQFVACADYFPDKAASFAKKCEIDASRVYTGLSGYKRLLESKLDAVVVESPPYFHPEHAAAGVEAGKHVYVAKPIAVDVPGCNTIGDAGKKATEKKLAFLVDFQTRANPIYREAVKRVHNGDIGKIVSGEAVYYCDSTWGNGSFDHSNAELRLRNWGIDKLLSGDIITEQNIHALDVASWLIDEAPVSAIGYCGRKARTGNGDVNDHFAVIYNFPEVVLSFTSKQYGAGWDDIGVRVFGSRGTADTHYFGSVSIKGQTPYAGGSVGNLFSDGVALNVAEFHTNITTGQFANPTAVQGVRSNLTTILGRTAAYKKSLVTWDEMMKTAEKLEFDTKALKA